MPQSGQLPVGTSQTSIMPPENSFFDFLKRFRLIMLRALAWLLERPAAIIGWWLTNILWNIYILDYANPLQLFSQIQCNDLSHMQTCTDFFKALAIPGFALFNPASPLWVRGIDIALLVLMPVIYVQVKGALKRAKTLKDKDIPDEQEDALKSKSIPVKQPIVTYIAPFELSRLSANANQSGEFIGRKNEEELLRQYLVSKSERVLVLCGMSGIGKTSLAANAVGRIDSRKYFPDGVAVVLCNNQTDIVELIRLVLARFHIDSLLAGKSDVNEIRELVSQIFAGKKVLIILDNVESSESLVQDIVSVLCSEKGVKLLFTTQEQPVTASSTIPIRASRLEVLSDEEAVELFVKDWIFRRRDRENVVLSEGNRRAIERIVTSLGRHTKAIKLMAADAAEVGDALTAVADRLDGIRGLALSVGDGKTKKAMEVAFNKSIESVEDECQRLFVALAAFPSIEFGKRAVFMLARMFIDQTKFSNVGGREIAVIETVNRLIRRSLLEVPTSYNEQPGRDYERLRLHTLLRDAANRKFEALPLQARMNIYSVIANYYVTYVTQDTMTEETLSYDIANIHGVLEWAYAHGENEMVVSICKGMRKFWENRGLTTRNTKYLQRSVVTSQKTIQTMTASGQTIDVQNRDIDLEMAYGKTLYQEGKITESRKVLEEVYKFLERSSNEAHVPKKAEVLLDRGKAEQQDGELQKARIYYTHSISLLRANKKNRNRHREAELQTLLGEVAQQTGSIDAAKDYYKQSLVRLQEPQCVECLGRQIHNLVHLGEIALQYGDYQEAEKHYKAALSISQKIQSSSLRGWVIGHIGHLEYKRNRLREAKNRYKAALPLLTNELHECWLLGHLGHLIHMERITSTLEDAKRYLQDALDKAKITHNGRDEGKILEYLARVTEEQGDRENGRKNLDEAEYFMEEARNYYEQAIDKTKKFDSVYYADVSLAFGVFLINKQHDSAKGCEMISNAVSTYARMAVPDAKRARNIQSQYKCNI